jgi:uncharacterized membrane protein HdeD (DUF308 family)
MFRRLESLFAALGLLAALAGGYYFSDISKQPLFNLWNVLAVVAAAASFEGITVSVHGHRAHTRIPVFAGFVLSLVVALYVKFNYPEAQYAFLPAAALLLLTLVSAELRVGFKEADNRKPEHVGAAKPRKAAAKRR